MNLNLCIQSLVCKDGREISSAGEFETIGIQSLFADSDQSFIPASLRRRCSPLTRLALITASEALSGVADPSVVPTVFATRHGEASTTARLLRELAQNQPLSPMDFSLSVHNAASGVHSIATNAKVPTTAITGGPDTFFSGVVEAVQQLSSHRYENVLLVCYDEMVPEVFLGGKRSDDTVFCLGVLFSRSTGVDLRLQLKPQDGSPVQIVSTLALDFARWFLSDTKEPLSYSSGDLVLQIDKCS